VKHARTALPLFALLALTTIAIAAPPTAGPPVKMPGLQAAATITVDDEGIAHIRANNPHDLYFLQGWVHARDRFFQMDVNRRIASGTYGELVGPAALESDVTLRTLGLRRAAVRSLEAVSPETGAALRAFSDGVNAWLRSHPLPPEYGVLELTRPAPWSPVDSVVIGKLLAFSLAFELDIDRTIALLSYVEAGSVAGFDGSALFHRDLWRSAGFDPNATVPDAMGGAKAGSAVEIAFAASGIDEATLALARGYLERVRDVPAFRPILDPDQRPGSNLWAVSGALTATGHPVMANDPHLPLGMPSTFYPNGLELLDDPVFGSSFPGVPGVVQGYNSRFAWGTTNNAVDVTDTFQEQVVPDPNSPSGLSTLHEGVPEPLIPIPESYRVNQVGNGVPDDVVPVPPGGAIPPATLVMPRRGFGPIVALDPASGRALSVQFVGFGPTREVETFLRINRARNLEEFREALQRFDFGSQNFVYADRTGTIAYFTSGEIPVREDLQAMTVNGLPPWFLRNGQGANEWLPVRNPQPFQATPFEILPFSEMPQTVNPSAGYFVNCNNDPAGVTLDNDPLNQLRPGGGLYYMAYSWDRGYRANRIEQRIAALLGSGDGKVSLDEAREIQGDVVQRDAQFFVPHLLAAFERASDPAAIPPLAALTADPRIAEAITRLAAWDGSTPTGIPEGYDASDFLGMRDLPIEEEERASVAATIYGVWRSRFVANTIDAVLSAYGNLPRPPDQETVAALRYLLDSFEAMGGVGASGIDFFQVPGVSEAADRRDLVLLTSLAEGLDALASEPFAPAFGGSSDLADYRWGRLHRLVLAHPLGGPFSVPPALGTFPPPIPGLPGIPTDGGYQCIDASHHRVRAADATQFLYTNGPNRRFAADLGPSAIEAWSIWPGGTSGIVGSPGSLRFLERFLTDDSIRVRLGKEEVKPFAAFVEKYVPAPRGQRPRGSLR
jgi:penicillin amidase